MHVKVTAAAAPKTLSCNHQKKLWLCLSGKTVASKLKSSQDETSRLDLSNTQLLNGLAANNLHS